MIPSNVLFVGLGGAGQRHARILRNILPEGTRFSAYRRTSNTPLLRADFTTDTEGAVEDAYGLTLFDSPEAAFASGPDLTVISTPTGCHREPMLMALDAGSGVMVEKPWAQDLEGFASFRDGILAKDLPFLISFQRRFHPFIRRAREAVRTGRIGRPISARFTVFSDVTRWHPYEDWRGGYAVRRELGGGVLLTESHEVDLALWWFGLPEKVFCSGGNRSAETLDVEDTVHLELLYPRFTVQIALCFMHAKPSRSFHIAGTEGDLSWSEQGNRLTLTRFPEDPETQADGTYGNDSMFLAQAKSFVFDWSPADTVESLNAAAGSLAIIEAARRSMRSGAAESVDGSLLLTPTG